MTGSPLAESPAVFWQATSAHGARQVRSRDGDGDGERPDWWHLCRVPGVDAIDPPLLQVWACDWPRQDEVLGAGELALAGELCLLTAHGVWVALEWVSGIAEHLDIDLSGITHIDAAGVSLLLKLRARLAERRRPLHLHTPSPIVATVLAILDLDGLVHAPPAPATGPP
jgi:anti-sigma B factor antagonist